MEEATSSLSYLNYYRKNRSNVPFVCYPRQASGIGIWMGENPITFTVPLFCFQLLIIVVISRLIHMIIRPLRQPRYLSEIIAGFILGPSVMGRIPKFDIIIFPLRSLIILDTFAQFGIIYFAFILGVRAEKYTTMKMSLKAWAFSIACSTPTFALGSLSSFFIHHRFHDSCNQWAFFLFLGVNLSDTSFYSLTQTLLELKLINSELGQLTLCSAMITHRFMCVVLFFAMYLGQSDGDVLGGLWAILSGIVLFLSSILLLKPALCWLERKIPEGEEVDEIYTSMILVAVLVWALIADILGTHCVFGALIFGTSVPSGRLGEALIEKVEDFNNGIFIPLVSLINGLRTNLNLITDTASTILLIMVILTSMIIKVIVGAFMATMYKMPPYEGVSIGLLLNTRDSLNVIDLYICSKKGVLGDESFTVILMMSVFLNLAVSPLIRAMVAPSSRNFVFYKRRSIFWPNMDSELRCLVCVYVPRQVPGLISLVDLAHPTKHSPIFVYALHLIELTGRSAIFLLNSATGDVAEDGSNVQSRVESQSGHILHAFRSYGHYSDGVSVKFLTAVAPYATMEEDVISGAVERHAAVILLPFHKYITVDSTMRLEHPAIRDINRKVLDSAPCSVGILIDRGLSGHRILRRITLLFFGGPDDREGLALLSRMAEHAAAEVTVVRFLHAVKAYSPERHGGPPQTEGVVTSVGEDEDNRKDEYCLAAFKARNRGRLVGYEQRLVNNAEETVSEMKGMMENGGQQLYVVGRGKGKESPMTKGLAKWTQWPELGPIGDMLASPEFGTTASVLVLQQGAQVHCRR